MREDRLYNSPLPNRNVIVSIEQYRRVSQLVTQFHDRVEDIGQFQPLDAGDMATPFRQLLHHQRHMTTALRRHFDSPLTVDVLATVQEPSRYQREILLRRMTDGITVEYGLLNADLSRLPKALCDALETGKYPFGQVIVDQGWNTSVAVDQLWRIDIGPALATIVGCEPGLVTFGRLASIAIDGSAAIEVLEIVFLEPDAIAAGRADGITTRTQNTA
jgi:hypothetical protein